MSIIIPQTTPAIIPQITSERLKSLVQTGNVVDISTNQVNTGYDSQRRADIIAADILVAIEAKDPFFTSAAWELYTDDQNIVHALYYDQNNEAAANAVNAFLEGKNTEFKAPYEVKSGFFFPEL